MNAARSWNVLAASVAGTGHVARQLPCQDAHAVVRLDNGALIAAVADGAGSAKRSDEGAACAVRAGTQFLAYRLRERVPENATECEQWLAAAVDAARAALLEQFPAEALPELATTLLLTFVSGPWLASIQIGDGATVCRDGRGQLHVLSKEARGEYVNETSFLTSANYRASVHTSILRDAEIDALAMLSDGVEFLALRYSDNTAHEPFFSALFAFARNSASTHRELEDFLSSERVCERTDDDKTLVLAVRHAAG
jgi:hypothetical protein